MSDSHESHDHHHNHNLHDHANNEIFCIMTTSLWLFTVPLYIYGFSKWRQFRRHFLITKRFPIITYLLAATAIIEHVILTVCLWLFTYNRHSQIVADIISTAEGSEFFALSIVLYRTLLIYLKRRACEQNWTKFVSQRIIIHGESTTTASGSRPSLIGSTLPTHKIYRHTLSYCYLAFIVVGTLCILLKDIVYPKIDRAVWTCAVLLSIVMVTITRKLKEGIGVTLESRIIAVAVLCIFPIQHFEKYHPALGYISHYLELFTLLLWGLLPIYLTLHYIHKCEGTLNAKVLTTANRQRSEKHLVMSDHASSGEATGTCANQVVPQLTKPPTQLDLTQPLAFFLEDKKNYTVFARYLCHCFAIENLLFLEKVCIFHEVVRALMDECRANELVQQADDEVDPEIVDAEIIYDTMMEITSTSTKTTATWPVSTVSMNEIANSPRIQFAFLESVYVEFRALIQTECEKYCTELALHGTSDGKEHCTDFASCKRGLDLLVQHFVDEYIVEDAPYQVNIACDQRDSILVIATRLDRLVKFEDYLQLFADALMEVFQLNVSLYKYTFKAYIEKERLV